MNVTIFIVIFVVITLVTVFMATREKDDLVDQDQKIPRGKGKKIDTGPQMYEIDSVTKQTELKKILKQKDIHEGK